VRKTQCETCERQKEKEGEKRTRAFGRTELYRAEVTWNFGSAYRRVRFNSFVFFVSNRVTRRTKETDRHGNTVCGSAAVAAYQDAVVSVSEIIMWCDVSQVSVSRAVPRASVLACSRTRSAARPFFSQPPIPSLAPSRTPPCAFPSFGVYDTRAAFPRFVPAVESAVT